MILSETEEGGAHQVAEKICREVESRARFPDGRGGEVRVTVSIGLALFPADAADKSSLVAAADSALYRAKSAGKNRVCR